MRRPHGSHDFAMGHCTGELVNQLFDIVKHVLPAGLCKTVADLQIKDEAILSKAVLLALLHRGVMPSDGPTLSDARFWELGVSCALSAEVLEGLVKDSSKIASKKREGYEPIGEVEARMDAAARRLAILNDDLNVRFDDAERACELAVGSIQALKVEHLVCQVPWRYKWHNVTRKDELSRIRWRKEVPDPCVPPDPDPARPRARLR